jgi:N-acetylglutamate synthase-like GNAT family acetyltransferase
MTAVKELFLALELAHYAERFRHKLFVVALTAQTPFRDVLHDLRVLSGYHIQVLLVALDTDFQLDRIVSQSNKRGTRFQLLLLTEVAFTPGKGPPRIDYERLKADMRQGLMPIVAHHGEPPAPGRLEPTFELAGELAEQLGADKLYLVTPEVGPWLGAASRTQVLREEISRLDAELSNAGLTGQEPLLGFIHGLLGRGVPDIVVVEGRPSYLFREVFTHDGAGILFTKVKPARVRQAEVKDITDISLLLTPEMEAGRILRIDENDIEANIGHYWVYEIDGLLVGLARLKVYGDWAELAQFTTLPRYRGKGRARDLAQKLMSLAREQGLSVVFALSIDPRMWEFFKELGFREIDRAKLPSAWRENYDLSRPSRALVRALN